MAKTKDGFYKQYSSLLGSNDLILLSGGGTTPISYYTPSTAYNNTNGCLVKTDIKTDSNTMITFRIEGNGYNNSNNIFTTGNFYNYKDWDQILQAKAYHHGLDFGKITVFCYDGYVHMWFKQTHNYQSFIVTVYSTNASPYNVNRVTSISNAAIPSSGVSRSVEIIPTVDSVTGGGSSGGSSLTVSIAGTSKTLTIPTSLPASGGSATNLLGGAKGSIPYQSAANTTTFLAAGSSGQVLKMNSSGLPYWTSDNYTSYVNTTNFPGLNKTGTVTSVTITQGTGITVSNSGTAITTSGTRTITLNAASSDAIGGVQLGYTPSGANIPLQTSSNKGYVALTKAAIVSALGYTPPTSDTNTDTKVTNTLATTTKFYVTGTSSASTNTGT